MRRLGLALAVLVLGPSCAPLATFRPASALTTSRNTELGLGAVAVSPRPYVDEQWLHSGQMWLTHVHRAARADGPLQLAAAATDVAAVHGSGELRLHLATEKGQLHLGSNLIINQRRAM
jgi:hypothetical protein